MQVVVIVDGMTILVVPVVWQRELEALHNIQPGFGPCPPLHLANVVRDQRPSCRHHLHDTIGLLQPPQEVLHAVKHARDSPRVSDLRLVESIRHGVARNLRWPVPSLLDHGACKQSDLSTPQEPSTHRSRSQE